MLHMVVISHGPETCAAVHPHLGEKARNGISQVKDAGGQLGVSVQGWWVDAPGHVFYMLADAPNAHAVNQLMTQLELFHWNTIDIHPVVTMEEAISLAAR